MKTLLRATLILIALFIDGLQAGLSWGFATAGVAVGGTLQLIPVAGTIAGAAAVPLGIVLGFVVDFCLSATLGAGLVMLFIWNDMYYPQYLFGSAILELIPGFDDLPGWTFMAIMCVIRKTGEEGGKLAGVAKLVTAGVALADGNVVGAVKEGVGAVQTMQQPVPTRSAANDTDTAEEKSSDPQSHVSINLKNVEGVRPPIVGGSILKNAA